MAEPTTEILDDFNRANEDPLAGNWTQKVSPDEGTELLLISNSVVNAAVFDPCSAYWNVGTFAADQECYVSDIAVAITPGMRLYARMADPNTLSLSGYCCSYSGAEGTLALYRFDSASPILLDSAVVGASYSRMLLTAIGDELTVSLYSAEGATWTQFLTVTDATYNHAGYIGMGAAPSDDAPSLTLDNFGGGNYSADVPLTAVTIAGATAAAANTAIPLTATPTPLDATTPIAYTWSATGLQSGQGTSSVSYQFGAGYAGTSVTISLTATNLSGAYTASDTHTIAIYDNLARAHICALLASVTDTGNVYCFKRHLVLREKLVELFQHTVGDAEVLRGFDIELRSISEERNQFGSGLLRTYNFNIFGYFAWQDPSADPAHTTGAPSEEVAVAIVLEVVNALDADPTLHDSDYHYDCSKAQVTAIEPWVWCNELIHRATITLAVVDFVNQ